MRHKADIPATARLAAIRGVISTFQVQIGAVWPK